MQTLNTLSTTFFYLSLHIKEWRKEDRRLLGRGMKFVNEIERYIRIDGGRVREDARKEKKGRGRPHKISQGVIIFMMILHMILHTLLPYRQLAGLWLALSGMKWCSYCSYSFGMAIKSIWRC